VYAGGGFLVQSLLQAKTNKKMNIIRKIFFIMFLLFNFSQGIF